MRVLLDLEPTCVSSCKRQNLESESNKEERKKRQWEPHAEYSKASSLLLSLHFQ